VWAFFLYRAVFGKDDFSEGKSSNASFTENRLAALYSLVYKYFNTLSAMNVSSSFLYVLNP